MLKRFSPVNIVNSKGDDTVLISCSDWRDIEETIYLNLIPRIEKLIGNLDGLFSRRISLQHRIVYKVYEDLKEIFVKNVISSCFI